MNMDQAMIEARHLLRKHVLVSRIRGMAMTVRCSECGKNGADHADGIMHYADCRYAKLMEALGEKPRWDQSYQKASTKLHSVYPEKKDEPDKTIAVTQGAADCYS